jgi:hypothetical protein
VVDVVPRITPTPNTPRSFLSVSLFAETTTAAMRARTRFALRRERRREGVRRATALDQWELRKKQTPFADLFTFHTDRATVDVDDPLGDPQPKAGT